ncbi:MAG: ATP-binding protein [Syntrophorhabdaceae bacterium]|nr:ATP-binding protein [Syntrophorhabdaceae bacterium]
MPVDPLQYTPKITLEFKIGEKDFYMAGESASRTKRTLQQLGLNQEVIKRVAIIIYEAAMNVTIHATKGVLKILIDPNEIDVITEDEGPGIPDIDLAMQEGYSTAPYEVREMGFGAGMGLPNIKQNSDELHIETKVGVGTTVKAKVYLKEGGFTSA